MTRTLPTLEGLYRGMGRMVVRFNCRTPGSDCVIAPHAILGCSGLDSVFLNCGVVFGDGPDGEDPAEGRLREFTARIRDRGVGGCVCLSEEVQRRLEPLARELGLEPLPPIPLMVRPGGAAAVAAGRGEEAPEPAAVERVSTAAGLAELLAVSEAAFDLPVGLYGRVVTGDLLADGALSVYVSRAEGRAVACACVVDDDGLAGISGMATLPEWQRRGLGTALLRHLLGDHADRARAFYLTSSQVGQALYRRCGFESVDAATAWIVPPPA